MDEYPESEKLAKASNEMRAIRAFLDWAEEEKGYHLEAVRGEPMRTESTGALLYEHFGIDEKKLEAERRAMLEKLAGN